MIADNYLQLRGRLETALGALLRLSTEMRREPAMIDTVQALLSGVRDPFLFVVVGEVKAGKSSLLNAMFGRDFCKVDVLPATDRIYIFKYGDEEQSIVVSSQLTERHQPIEFLRDFNIVDTPGTNTMVAEHQTITENFVPRADLILFVFSVVNPWGASAWELLRFVHQQWLKNVIFVLQQADLRDAGEIGIIQRHLAETAVQKLGFAPPIFAVSARKAFLSRTTGLDRETLWRESNFGALEEHINAMVAREGTRMLKLASTCATASLILSDAGKQVRSSLQTIAEDEARLTRVRGIFAARQEQTLQQVAGFLRGIEGACTQFEKQGQAMLAEHLSFWRTWRLVFGRDEWQHRFQVDLETKMRDVIGPQVENAVELLETDLRGLWPQLQDMMENEFGASARAQITHAIPDFARQRRQLLQSVQLTLAQRIAGAGLENRLKQMFRETAHLLRLPAGVAAAGGIVTVIAAMTSAAVADVTGIIAASAAVIGTFVAFGRRKKILAEYRAQMASKREELVQAVEQHLRHAVDLFYNEIGAAFGPLEAFCSAERLRYEPLLARVRAQEKALAQLTSEVVKT